MNWMFPAIIATLASTLVLMLVYLYLYYRDRESSVAVWSLAWFFYLLRFVFALFMLVWSPSHLLMVADQLTSLLSSIFLLMGSYLFLRKRMPRYWIWFSIVMAVWIYVSSYSHFSFVAVSLPIFFFLGLIMIMMGYLVIRYVRVSLFIRCLVGVNLILWGVHKFNYPFLKPVIWFAPWGYLLGAIFALVAALGMILIYFERARDELTRSEEKFRQLAENIPEVFWLVSPSWDEVIYISPSYESVWGRSRESLYESPRSWMDSINDEDREKLQTLIVSADLESGGPVIFPEYRIRTDAGEEKWIYARAFPIRNERGEVYRVAGIAEDITVRKQTGEYMVQAEKMMMVGSLAAGMAHEINNPLAVITLSMDSIMQKLDPGSEQARGEAAGFGIDLDRLRDFFNRAGIMAHFDRTGRSAMRAAGIIRDMLDFSRKNWEKSMVDVAEIVNGVVDMARRDYEMNSRYGISRVTFRYDYPSPALSVTCIRSQLEQVLLNIIRNAVQAMSDAGEGARKPEILVRAFHKDESVVIEIADNGPGMDEEQQKRVFEPFYSTKGPGLGTGLGLFVSYFIIVEHHGGRISLSSNKGEGATFRITLPI